MKTKHVLGRAALAAFLLTAFAAHADVKISALPAASALGGTEVAPVVQSATTVGATANQFKTYTLASYAGASTITTLGTISTGVWNGTAINLATSVSGILPTANGGTGVGTLTGIVKGSGTSNFAAAVSSDVYGLWTGTCNSSSFLRGDGTCATPSSGSPGGSNTQIQFNDSGSFGGDAEFLWDKTNNINTIGSVATPGIIKGADSSSGAGALITLKGGASTNSGSAGGAVTVVGGTSSEGAGGAINVTGGLGVTASAANRAGGAIAIAGGGGVTAATGGTASLAGGAGGATGLGGAVTVAGGAGGATSGNGGNATLKGGIPIDGDGGNVNITGTAGVGTNRGGGTITATGGNASGTNAGGSVIYTAGNGGATGTAGDVSLNAGAGGTTSGNGGLATLRGGLPVDGNGGSVSVTARDGVGTNRNGGNVTITIGAPTGSGTVGALTLVGATTTGAQTATFTASNKPGSGTGAPTLWLRVIVTGTTYWIPLFAN